MPLSTRNFRVLFPTARSSLEKPLFSGGSAFAGTRYWYVVSLAEVQRIFRRVEQVVGRLCCGGQNFVIERLVLILKDGSEVVIHIGDDVQPAAEALLQALKDTHPELEYGVQK